MGKTGETPETPADGEQIEEEEKVEEDPSGDNETPVIDEPVEDPDTDPVEEPTEDEVEGPTADPETPVESEEPKDVNTVNGVEINAVGDKYTVTIANYATLRNQVTFTATVGGESVKIPANGQITAEEGENSAKPAIALTLEAKTGYKITAVKNGDTDVPGSNGTYSIPNLTADTTITVTTAAVYTLSVANQGGTTYGVKVKTGEGESATETTVVNEATAVFEKGALEFTVDGYGAAADGSDRLKVYYVTDGSSDDDTTEIEGVETTTGEGQAAVKTTTYTVPAAVINSLDESIKIILQKEEKKAVTVDTSNTNVEVQYWGKKNASAAETDPAEAWVVETGDNANNTKYDKITTAFVGDTFKFKATAKGNYAISKVKVGDTELTLVANGEYSVTVTEEMLDADSPAEISFETVLDSTKSRTLTYTLAGDENSATAKIISVTPAASEGQTATATTDADEMAAALGIDTSALTLVSGETISVLSAPTEIKVEIAPATDYELIPASTSGTIAENDTKSVYTITGTAAVTITAATQDVALAGTDSKFFKPGVKSGSEDVLTDLTVATDANVIKGTGEADGTYEVKPGARNVTFTVKAKEGFKVKDFAANSAVKSVTAGTPAADGSVLYTVTLTAAKLTATTAAAAAADAIEVEKEAILLTAEVEAAEGSDAAEYNAVMQTRGTEEGDEFEDYTSGNIAFGSSFRATITPATGCGIDEVSYVMGTAAAVTVPVTLNEYDEPEALINIDKMTGNVKITVKSGKAYELTTLTDSEGNEIEADADGIYPVAYGEKYLVGVTQGGVLVPARNVTVAVKDASGAAVAMTNPIISGKRSINLANKNLAGQEITADIFVKGVENAVGTYIMSVEKKTTAITVNGGNAIEQSVDSVATYDFTTDGDLNNVDVSVSGEIRSLISADIVNGKLEVTVDPAKRDDIATSSTTGSGETAVTTWTAKKATITVSALDDEDVEASVEITLKALFDEDAAPTVSLVDAADTVLNVSVGMADVATPKSGSVWYEVTATAKANTPAQGDTPASNKPDNLQSTVTQIVRKTGSSNRVALQVGNSSNLGEGAEWGYDVTAKLIYKEGKQSASSTVVESKVSETLETATKTPLFEDALKLKKAKGAPAKLYTGQTDEIVIAEPQWTKKFSSYKILSDQIYDSARDLSLDVNADGNIVVTNVPVDATLGKHTITVVATADETTGHTMYASRATITVNVVKGINNMIVTQPSESIYKADKKAGTLKLGVDYNHDYVGQPDDYDNNYASWNGKKYISAPATKKVTWSIVDASSDEYDIVAAPAYLNVDTTGKGKTAANGVGVKNGTVMVGKNFVIDERHANNNRFKVLVEATDFTGNTTKALSETITITKDALDISTLVVVHENENDDMVVTAVHDIKDKKPVSVLASDVNGGYLYALPENAGVTAGAAWTRTLERTAAPLENLTMTTTNKKVLEVYSRNRLNILAAGKKAGIKVTANDGSKKTHTMTLTLDYKETAGSDLALGISYRTDNDKFGGNLTSIFAPTGANVAKANAANVKETPVEAKFTATGAARLYVQLYVGNKADSTSTTYTRPGDVWATNYKLAVKGGKVISNANGSATIVTTAKETTLTLTDQTKEAKAAKKKAYVYKIVNEAYDNTKLAKAPKVTVKGSLHAFGTAKEQNEALTLTVLDAANKNALFAKEKTVKVEMDWSARTDKNYYMLNDFAEYLNLSSGSTNTVALGETGTISLFGGYEDKDEWINPYTGSFKLKVTVGTGNGGSFKAETLPATVTVKVVKNKAFTFKPTTSYTINKVDGGAVLTGKANLNAKAGEILGMNFYNLQNANIKGTSNKFTHYFTVAEDPITHTQRLTLNTEDDLVKAMLFEKKEDGTIDTTKPIEDPAITIPKEDLTGYISYYAEPSVSYYSNRYAQGTVKITVKIAPEIKPGKAAKASQKYAANRAEVALTANAATEMNVIVNGAYVSVAYAMVDADKKGNAEELAVDLAGNAKGQIVLKTTKAVEEGKTYSTNLLIVPDSSFYKGLIDKATAATAAREGEAAAAATKQDLIKKYGIAIKVSVLASKTPVKTPDPTQVGGGEEPEPEVQDVPETFKEALKSAAQNVQIAKDEFTAPADDAEEGTMGTISTEKAAAIKTRIESAINGVDGYSDYTVTVGSTFTVTKNATTEGAGEATGTITIEREGYNTATVEITLVIEQQETTTPDTL